MQLFLRFSLLVSTLTSLAQDSTLVAIDEKYRETKRGSREEMCLDVKDVVSKLEGWAEEIAKKEGSLQFKHINKRIKSDREVALKIEEKYKAWRRLKECKEEDSRKYLERIYGIRRTD